MRIEKSSVACHPQVEEIEPRQEEGKLGPDLTRGVWVPGLRVASLRTPRGQVLESRQQESHPNRVPGAPQVEGLQ